MKEKLEALWAKVQEHKDLVIKVGLALAGVAVGAIVATVIVNAQENYTDDVDTMLEEGDEREVEENED